jgi:signal transduction histidine kinase
MHQSSKLHLGVPESLLRKLLRRYPHGKVFNFDDDGSLSASEGASDTSVEETRKSEESTHQEKLKPRKMSREEEGKAILKVCPGARCVAFFPLWDSHKERWFVGNLAWTTDPTRVLDPEEDLTYLAAFGNSIMAEVSRLNAVTSSQMKNSFISGISHELRSPLHGVLASVEFLQDSTMSEQQQEMVSIIGFCGRTLLDTLNHVLDFTKLRNAPKHTPESGRRNQPNEFSFSRDRLLQESIPVDLRLLTEEVIEGVYVGNCFAKSSPMNKDILLVSGQSPPTKSQASAPMIILDLEPRSNWALDIDPGAWRRLIMNIFGNALKYTETGFIRVSLKSSDDVQSADGISSSMVTLTVTDTGKGISQEFLNHQMYTPFAQEDSLAAGSGLGLSIVRHIVNELRGSIEIESAQGSGTEVKIILSLRSSYVSLSSSASLDPLPSVQKNLRGLDVCLVGFDMFPDVGDRPKGTMSVEAKRMFSFKSSITSLLSGWFEMRALTAPTLEESTAKISCIMESTFDEMLSAGWLGADSGTHQVEKSLLLVLRTEPYQSCPSLSHSKYDIIYVQQP